MTRVLLTGFEPFDGDVLNPSWEVARALDGGLVTALRLPCEFGRAKELLWQALDSGRFDVLLSLGLAGNRPDVTVERIAINVDDARIPDNAGQQPVDVPVVAGGPAAYWSGLPIKRMVAAVRAAGVPASVSQTAGTFVCNHVFYGLMHTIAANPELCHTRGGFVHVPWLPEQGTPNMALDDVVRGLRVAVRAALTTPQDTLLAGGATH